MKDTELNVNQEQLNNLKQQVNGVEPAGGANDKKSEIQADLNNAQLDLNAQVEQANKEIQAEKEADKEKNDVQAEAGLDQKQPVKAAPIEDPAQRMQALENYLVQTQAQIKELSEQNRKLSQILLASMEEKKKQDNPSLRAACASSPGVRSKNSGTEQKNSYSVFSAVSRGCSCSR